MATNKDEPSSNKIAWLGKPSLVLEPAGKRSGKIYFYDEFKNDVNIRKYDTNVINILFAKNIDECK